MPCYSLPPLPGLRMACPPLFPHSLRWGLPSTAPTGAQPIVGLVRSTMAAGRFPSPEIASRQFSKRLSLLPHPQRQAFLPGRQVPVIGQLLRIHKRVPRQPLRPAELGVDDPRHLLESPIGGLEEGIL